ncbi:MAG: PilZ domain-containing protein [Sphingomonadaceae bacterium]
MNAAATDLDVGDHKPRAARLTTILLVARMSIGQRDDLCRVRNISVGGMRIETLASVEVGQAIDVELKNGVSVRAEVMWVRDAAAGVRFEAPVDIAEVLAPAGKTRAAAGERTMRSPRLSAQCPVELRQNGRALPADLINISQGGAQVRAAERLRLDDDVVVAIPGLDVRMAVVRWAKDNVIGLGFIEKLRFKELAEWLAGPDRFGPATQSSVSQAPQSS